MNKRQAKKYAKKRFEKHFEKHFEKQIKEQDKYIDSISLIPIVAEKAKITMTQVAEGFNNLYKELEKSKLKKHQ